MFANRKCSERLPLKRRFKPGFARPARGVTGGHADSGTFWEGPKARNSSAQSNQLGGFRFHSRALKEARSSSMSLRRGRRRSSPSDMVGHVPRVARAYRPQGIVICRPRLVAWAEDFRTIGAGEKGRVWFTHWVDRQPRIRRRGLRSQPLVRVPLPSHREAVFRDRFNYDPPFLDYRL